MKVLSKMSNLLFNWTDGINPSAPPKGTVKHARTDKQRKARKRGIAGRKANLKRRLK